VFFGDFHRNFAAGPVVQDYFCISNYATVKASCLGGWFKKEKEKIGLNIVGGWK
jgi:hypothetical protein